MQPAGHRLVLLLPQRVVQILDRHRLLETLRRRRYLLVRPGLDRPRRAADEPGVRRANEEVAGAWERHVAARCDSLGRVSRVDHAGPRPEEVLQARHTGLLLELFEALLRLKRLRHSAVLRVLLARPQGVGRLFLTEEPSRRDTLRCNLDRVARRRRRG